MLGFIVSIAALLCFQRLPLLHLRVGSVIVGKSVRCRRHHCPAFFLRIRLHLPHERDYLRFHSLSAASSSAIVKTALTTSLHSADNQHGAEVSSAKV